MDTESLKYARFDHPVHGGFDTADAVAADPRLKGEEKQAILAEWKRRVEADAAADPDAARIGASIDEAVARLASLRS